MKKLLLKIVFIPINFPFIHCSGFWLIFKANILKICWYKSRTLEIRKIPKYEIGYTVEAFISVKLFHVFLYIPSDRKSMPILNSPGPFLLPKSTGKFRASFRRHYLDFLALFPLKNFTLPDGLTTRWQVDTPVTRGGNLERIYFGHKITHVRT